MKGQEVADAILGTHLPELAPRTRPPTLAVACHSLGKLLRSPTPYLTVFGIGLWLFLYWAATEGLKLPRFEKIPGPANIVGDLFARHPEQGVSVFTDIYWQHVYVSCQRVFIAFCIATGIGVPLGLLMGWSRTLKDYTFPILETLRPIPILAWVPLAIMMFKIGRASCR